MEHAVHRFSLSSAHDGLKLSCFSIVPESPRAVVQMTHGMNEHKDRYLPLAQYLANKGFCVVMHDHRGHGKSVRTKSDLGFFYDDGAAGIVADLAQVNRYCKETFPDLPVFLFAHSMGTLAARVYLKEHDSDIDGVILCGAPVKNPMVIPGIVLLRTMSMILGQRHRSHLATALVLGGFRKKFPNEEKSAWICTDQEVVQAYMADPLCNYEFTLNGYLNLLHLMRGSFSLKGWQMGNPELPIRFIAGEDDPCIENETKFAQSVQFLQNRGYSTVTSRLFPAMRHEIHNEKEHAQVFHDIEKTLSGWLRLAQKRKKY